jgi:hypothetical protein
MAASKFQFYPMGIGQLLRQGRLEVPPNQRAYAWRDKHVRNLMVDLHDAIFDNKTNEDYFLGTIVLVRSEDEPPSIVDGQQRLATTLILLARIRDHFLKMGREGSARSIEEAFLGHTDVGSEKLVSRVKLNEEDNEFFNVRIVPRNAETDDEIKSSAQPVRQSNRRLLRASRLASQYISQTLETVAPERRADALVRWFEFIDTKASVLAVYVPDEVGAFRMFETLNDRGLRASQADILKNYFFSRAPDRLAEAKTMWSEIATTIEIPVRDTSDEGDEGDGDEDDENKNDPLVTYIRHFWITEHGPTKERELAAEIRIEITSENKTMQFLNKARDASKDYAALRSSRHPKWKSYKPTTRQSVDTMAEHVRVKQIRPLLFAVAHHFTPVEADKAFKLFVSWSVRFLIVGGRGGMLDQQYSLRAQEVGTKRITKARELREAMEEYVPTDTEFEEQFTVARVSRPYLARYYLRALEKAAKGLAHPEYIENEEVADVDLEHVIPLTPNKNWKQTDEAARASVKFLGNMALIRAPTNSKLGGASFADKKKEYANSGYLLTKEIARYGDKWGIEQIRDRQSRMAKLAVKTWSLDFTDN